MGWSVFTDINYISFVNLCRVPASSFSQFGQHLSVLLLFFSGLHEEVDYSEKLKFSDDEDEHSSDKKKMW